MNRRIWMSTIFAGALAIAGCGDGGDGGNGNGESGSGEATGETVVVFAAASLNEVFPAIAEDAGVSADFSFDGSSGLVDQLEGGAPADVLATADTRTMERAEEAGLLAGEPSEFATNQLSIVVQEGNPESVSSLEDADGLTLVVCDPEVPCGAATAEVAEAQSLDLQPASEELRVTDVVGKVASGEADLGVAYATDQQDGVELLPLEGAEDFQTTLWIAVLADAEHPEDAQAFVDLILDEGQAQLEETGFGTP